VKESKASHSEICRQGVLAFLFIESLYLTVVFNPSKKEEVAMKRFMILAVLLVSILAVSSTMALAQDDLVAFHKKHRDAIARGDVDAALALYADDAVLEGGPCSRSPCVGKAAIRKWLERSAKNKSRKITIVADYPSGNVLTTRVEVRNNQIRKAGVDRIITWGIWRIRGGKISFQHISPESSDPQTARYFKWRREQRKKRAR
jgi:ketosteroid isomerase-like protein